MISWFASFDLNSTAGFKEEKNQFFEQYNSFFDNLINFFGLSFYCDFMAVLWQKQ